MPDQDQDQPDERRDDAAGQDQNQPERQERRDDDQSDEPRDDRAKAVIDKIRREARESERARKVALAELEQLRKEKAARDEADLSEVERAKKQADDARREVEKYRTEALRYRIATEKGIDPDDADLFLTAPDEDGIRRQAERFAAVSLRRRDDQQDRDGDRADESREPRRPKPDPSQGSRGGKSSVQGDMASGVAMADKWLKQGGGMSTAWEHVTGS